MYYSITPFTYDKNDIICNMDDFNLKFGYIEGLIIFIDDKSEYICKLWYISNKLKLEHIRCSVITKNVILYTESLDTIFIKNMIKTYTKICIGRVGAVLTKRKKYKEQDEYMKIEIENIPTESTIDFPENKLTIIRYILNKMKLIDDGICIPSKLCYLRNRIINTIEEYKQDSTIKLDFKEYVINELLDYSF
uniref:Uncharacterized protein n=1 Tax=Pithovirus LCDPAC02 TaxID=2506601 RepID=A0A481YPH8_9VIRU|nr:MAG: hypothetical protein LCDPAC02_01390 [Pithovirus LCDPAC02]